jgi:hypothetical protein
MNLFTYDLNFDSKKQPEAKKKNGTEIIDFFSYLRDSFKAEK